MSFNNLDRYLALIAPEIGDDYAVTAEEQNGDYESGIVTFAGGATFAGATTFAGSTWRIRSARITPTKPGAFVAMWTRGSAGTTRPFELAEALSGTLVFLEDGEHFGVFRFASTTLQQLGYVSSGGNQGKRGFRVYPSWCEGLNSQAQRTRIAQAPSFIRFG